MSSLTTSAPPVDPTTADPITSKSTGKTRRVLRKKTKAPKPIDKYIWLTGHVLTLVFGTIYSFFYFLRFFIRWYWIPLISYRLSFIGVIASYSVSALTTFGSVIPSYNTLLATENFQSLLLGCIWLISRNSVFKLFPYFVVSLLQLAQHFNVKPLLKLANPLSDVIAFSEIAVIFALFFDTLLFRGTSGFALVLYLAFYWVRINFSPYTQFYILKIVHAIDTKIIVKQKPEIKAKWQKIKDFIELRRSQTETVIDEELDEEPPIKVENDHRDANKKVGEAKNYQVASLEDEKDFKNVNGGEKPSLDKINKGEIPVHAKDPQENYDKNFKAGVLASTSAAGAGFAAGVTSESAKLGRQHQEGVNREQNTTHAIKRQASDVISDVTSRSSQSTSQQRPQQTSSISSTTTASASQQRAPVNGQPIPQQRVDTVPQQQQPQQRVQGGPQFQQQRPQGGAQLNQQTPSSIPQTQQQKAPQVPQQRVQQPRVPTSPQVQHSTRQQHPYAQQAVSPQGKAPIDINVTNPDGKPIVQSKAPATGAVSSSTSRNAALDGSSTLNGSANSLIQHAQKLQQESLSEVERLKQLQKQAQDF